MARLCGSGACGCLGGREVQQAGGAGLVADGLVRDSREIGHVGFRGWCRGTTPIAPGKRNPGVVGGAVVIGGALVRDGDLVIADDLRTIL